MRYTKGLFMQPIFELNALFHTVIVYPHMIVLRPGMVKKMGGDQEKEILFANVSDVFLREATILANGYMHFSIRGEPDQEPPSLLRAGNDANTFMFRHGKNSEAIQIKKYVEDQMKNPQSLLGMGGSRASEQPKSARPPSPCDSEDFDRYRKMTAEQDWTGIFRFNSLRKDLVGVGKELRVLHQYLQDNEVVFALLAGVMSQTTTSNVTDTGFNTWLGVLTDKRILMLDHAMLSESVDTQSIRHDRIQAISSSQGWMFGKVTIDIGNRSIMIENCDKEHVKAFSSIANDWLEYIGGRVVGESTRPRDYPVSDRDPIEEIRRLAELKDAGILSEEEFGRAKAALLSKM